MISARVLLRFLPRVKGTTQKVHILSQPQVMLTSRYTITSQTELGRHRHGFIFRGWHSTASRPSSHFLEAGWAGLLVGIRAYDHVHDFFFFFEICSSRRSAMQPKTLHLHVGLIFLYRVVLFQTFPHRLLSFAVADGAGIDESTKSASSSFCVVS